MMNSTEQTILWLGAFQHYLARKPKNATSRFCDLLIREWPTLPDYCKQRIQEDLEIAFSQDDYDRENFTYNGAVMRRLGDDSDRSQWEKVRELWK